MHRFRRLSIPALAFVLLTLAEQVAAVVVVQGAPPDVQLAASKLSWDLSLLRNPGDRFVGTTRDGRPVIQPANDAALQALSKRPGVTALKSVATERVDEIDQAIVFYTGSEPPKALPGGLEVVSAHPEGRFVVVAGPGDEGLTFEDVDSLADSDAVRFVEPNYPYRLVEGSGQPPNDPDLVKLWGMRNIRAPEAWRQVSSSPITVAVIDSGVDYTHPDLSENMWRNPGELAGNGRDDDGNGFVDDVHGYDFVANDGDPRDGHSHGTHCAGTIAAIGNNGTGVVGVSWKLGIMAVQIFDAQGNPALADDIARAIDYAVANGARVLSNSWAGPSRSAAIHAAIERARERGALFVAAASNDDGNDNDASPRYPASYASENIIAVLSIDDDDRLSDFSNVGRTTVDLGAPGGEIWSTVPGGYAPKSGTSMATPHVAGAAALVWGHPEHAGADWKTVRSLLLGNARKLASLDGKCATGASLDLAFLGGPAEVAEVEGTLRSPSFAMGGETTGTTVVTSEGPIDLDVSSLGDAAGRLEQLDGKRVEVRGQIRLESGVENPSRKVMDVLAIEEKR